MLTKYVQIFEELHESLSSSPDLNHDLQLAQAAKAIEAIDSDEVGRLERYKGIRSPPPKNNKGKR